MNMIEETLKLVRESKELGVGSCSTYDECYDDNELRQAIQNEVTLNPYITGEEIFQNFLKMERIRDEQESRYERINESRYAWQDVNAEEVESKCGGCGAKGNYYDGLCYQCQAEYHSVGAYDMDGSGWR